MKFTVLGLEDANLLLDRQTTTAKDCNQIARQLDQRCAALGGERFHALGESDDRTGNLEIEPWLESRQKSLPREPRSTLYGYRCTGQAHSKS